jgi:hypothetical protein
MNTTVASRVVAGKAACHLLLGCNSCQRRPCIVPENAVHSLKLMPTSILPALRCTATLYQPSEKIKSPPFDKYVLNQAMDTHHH